MSSPDSLLLTAFGEDRVIRDAALAPFTTFRVGGRADWLVSLRTASEIKQAGSIARSCGIPVSVIGGGSNLLVSDAGVRGLVIRVHGGDVRLFDESTVRADAGVTINGLVRWTIGRGIAGLEAWAGTPGTAGGAVFGNAHFQGQENRSSFSRSSLSRTTVSRRRWRAGRWNSGMTIVACIAPERSSFRLTSLRSAEIPIG